MPKERKLTLKQERFWQEYINDPEGNGSKAAIRAGYSKKTAGAAASRLLKNVNIQQIIKKFRKEARERTEVTLDEIINNAREVFKRCMNQVPVMIRQDGEWVGSGEYKFDSAGANKANEILGKTIGAFTDNVNIPGMVDFLGAIKKANESK